MEGFKKASFLDKILPYWGVFSGQFLVYRKEVNWKMRVEILSWTEGLNLLFWIPGTNLWLLFYPFFCKNVLFLWWWVIGDWFMGVQSGLVNKGVVFFFTLDDIVCARFDNMALWRWEKRKTHSCGSLIFEDAWVVFSGQFLMFSELEMGSIFKKQYDTS